MPPKKRSRSVSQDSATAAAPAAKARATPAKVIAHKTVGRVQRTPEALEWMDIKRTKEEIWDEALVKPYVRLTTDAQFKPSEMMKVITWNVAGLRGLLRKDEKVIASLCAREKPDVLCLQETKLQANDKANIENVSLGVVPGYVHVDHPCAVKNGYSGTRTYVKKEHADAGARHLCGFLPSGKFVDACGLDKQLVSAGEDDGEGRVLTTFLNAPGAASADFHPTLSVVNTYVPNSGLPLDRLAYRTGTFDPRMRQHLLALDAYCTAQAKSGAPAGFIWAGDLNVADRDTDRYFSGNYKSMLTTCGYTPEERLSFRATLTAVKGVDSFIHINGAQTAPAYTFWSARINGREHGLGWRIDYAIVSARLASRVVDCFPMPEVMGSDHCPLQLWLRTK